MPEIKPYHSEQWDKKAEVEIMFDRIAGKYDLLNRVLSLGIDRRWRKKALLKLSAYSPSSILDIATGTGDMVFLADRLLKPLHITGIDLSSNMLDIANNRLSEYTAHQHAKEILFQKGDAENLHFPDNSFDAVTVAFGVRNFANLQKGLTEINRVLKPGGPFLILEFTKPAVFPFRQLFNIYFRHLLPLIGSFTSGDRRAYKYLYESVQAFPDYDDFNKELTLAGFIDPHYQKLSAGICAIYTSFKP